MAARMRKREYCPELAGSKAGAPDWPTGDERPSLSPWPRTVSMTGSLRPVLQGRCRHFMAMAGISRSLAISAHRAAWGPAGKFGTSGHGRDWVTAFIESIHRGV
jgi:hypothetical protein